MLTAKGKQGVELLVVDDFIFEIMRNQKKDALLRPSYFRHQLRLYHLQHFEVEEGLDVVDLLPEITDHRGLVDESKSLDEVVIPDGGQAAKDEKLNLLQVLLPADGAELVLDDSSVLLWRLLLVLVCLHDLALPLCAIIAVVLDQSHGSE
jgi:hypothetical protein